MSETWETFSRGDILAWARSKCSSLKVIEPDFRAMAMWRYPTGMYGAVFYDSFRTRDCNMTVYVDNPRPISRRDIRAAFEYPFVQADLRRVTAVVNSRNTRSISIIERLGFVREGVRRFVYENGADEIIYGMLRSECPWLSLRERLEDPHTAGAF